MSDREPLRDSHHNCLHYPIWFEAERAIDPPEYTLGERDPCSGCDYDDGPDNFEVAPIPWGELR